MAIPKSTAVLPTVAAADTPRFLLEQFIDVFDLALADLVRAGRGQTSWCVHDEFIRAQARWLGRQGENVGTAEDLIVTSRAFAQARLTNLDVLARAAAAIHNLGDFLGLERRFTPLGDHLTTVYRVAWYLAQRPDQGDRTLSAGAVLRHLTGQPLRPASVAETAAALVQFNRAKLPDLIWTSSPGRLRGKRSKH